MEWVEVSVETKTEAADLVTAAFTDIGAGGVEIDDPALINAYIDEGRWDYRDMERKPETGNISTRTRSASILLFSPHGKNMKQSLMTLFFASTRARHSEQAHTRQHQCVSVLLSRW